MNNEELKQMSGDELIGIIKAQRFEIKEIDLLIQELRDTIDNQREEIDRLNVVINKYRIGIEDMWVDNAGEDTWIYNGKDFLSREEFLDKLKELKENNKDE